MADGANYGKPVLPNVQISGVRALIYLIQRMTPAEFKLVIWPFD